LPYFYFPSDWFYSEKLWQKVPEDLKQIIMGTVKEFEDLARGEFAKEAQSNVEKMKGQGVQFYEPTQEEIQKFRQDSLKVWQDYAVQVWGQDVVNRLKTEVMGIGG
jgi:TRAP-type C4-dicarboxylate transport system substrate-binding protein